MGEFPLPPQAPDQLDHTLGAPIGAVAHPLQDGPGPGIGQIPLQGVGAVEVNQRPSPLHPQRKGPQPPGYQPLVQAAVNQQVPVEQVPTMKELGAACGIAVGGAVAALLK